MSFIHGKSKAKKASEDNYSILQRKSEIRSTGVNGDGIVSHLELSGVVGFRLGPYVNEGNSITQIRSGWLAQRNQADLSVGKVRFTMAHVHH